MILTFFRAGLETKLKVDDMCRNQRKQASQDPKGYEVQEGVGLQRL